MAYPPTVPVNTRADATALATNHPADHNAISNALTDILNELGSDPSGTFPTVQARLALTDVTPWTAPTLVNSWANFGGGFQEAQYRKVGDIVHLRGLIGGGTAAPVTIFTLPVGFRPPATVLFSPVQNEGVYQSARIDVEPDGDVRAFVTGNDFLSLSGISFSTLA